MATAEPEEMNVKFFVTGVGGQLGHDVMNELLKRGHEGVGSDILTAYNGIIDNSPVSKAPYIPLDITDADAVERVITAVNPDAVIHCAAWTAVDLAENAENQEKVRAINAGGTQNIANVCKKLNCKMTYISTDYVFDGQGTAPWKPDCKDYKPLNVYGQTKLEGELAVSRTLDKYFIVRIAWVFGLNGKNFIKTMLNVGKTHDTVRVVNDQIGTAWRALHDPQKRVVVQIAPAVRVALGEDFGIPAGVNIIDKLVPALKIMGADEVYDTNFGADMTTISEAEEFLQRLKVGGPFPMFTSCCPAWVKYLELNDPKYLRNISTCKSPMEMFAAVIRDKYAAKDAADGRTTYQIAIMPCTAKKMEAARPEFCHDGRPDVDLVLTTRELTDMIREAGIQLNEMELESPDLPFGLGSGAAAIYGVTGGVAEAVVRYCVPDKSKNALRAVSVTDLRGDGAIREVNLTIDGQELHIAIVNGLIHAKELIADIEAGKRFYHLVEVMTCQGGCVGGAGQPYGLTAVKRKRKQGLYDTDASALFKRAEKNPIVTTLLDKYGEERCHELLHVHYDA